MKVMKKPQVKINLTLKRAATENIEWGDIHTYWVSFSKLWTYSMTQSEDHLGIELTTRANEIFMVFCATIRNSNWNFMCQAFPQGKITLQMEKEPLQLDELMEKFRLKCDKQIHGETTTDEEDSDMDIERFTN